MQAEVVRGLVQILCRFNGAALTPRQDLGQYGVKSRQRECIGPRIGNAREQSQWNAGKAESRVNSPGAISQRRRTWRIIGCLRAWGHLCVAVAGVTGCHHHWCYVRPLSMPNAASPKNEASKQRTARTQTFGHVWRLCRMLYCLEVIQIV